MVSMNGFSWDNKVISNSEIYDAFNNISSRYKIKSDEIIIGGFSSGGQASLNSIHEYKVPFSGFIILSPPKPDEFSKANVNNMINNNIRGSIITNPKDPRYNEQKQMAEIFDSMGMKNRFIETPDIGHWFPDNLGELIDQSIQFIRKKK